MFTAIVTWSGAMLGVAILLLMAVGSFAIDLENPKALRRKHEPVDKQPADHPG